MAENLDPELIQQLNENIAMMSENIALQNALFSSLGKAMAGSDAAFQKMASNARQAGETLDAYRSRVEQNTRLQEMEAAQKAEEAQRNARYEKIQQNAVRSVQSFTEALFKAESSFSKYGSTLDTVAGGAADLVSEFGKLGQAAAFAIKGLNLVAQYGLEMADNTLKASDQLTKMGGAGGLTARELLNMGHNAALTSKNLDLMTKPMQSLGSSMALLGTNADESISTFGSMLDETTGDMKEQRKAFQRLGVGHGELIQSMSDYVALQAASGRNIRNEAKDRLALQQASLEYTENLLVLSKVTNEDVETIKKRQQEAARAVEFQIAQINLETKARKAEASGTKEGKEEAARYRKQAEDQLKVISNISALGNDFVTKGARQFLATGAISQEEGAVLARMGLMEDLQQLRGAIQSGADAEEAAAKFQDAYNKKFGEIVETVGTSAQHSKDAAKAFGITEESLEIYNKTRDKNFSEETKAAKERIEEGKKEGKDPAQDARVALIEAEKTVTIEFERLAAKVNPLLNGFDDASTAATVLMGAAYAAAAALGVMAASSALSMGKDLLSKGKNLVTRGGPAPIAGAADDAAAAAARAAAGTADDAAAAAARAASGVTDDAARAITSLTDDAAGAIVRSADEAASVVATVGDDVAGAAIQSADDVAKGALGSLGQIAGPVLSVAAGAYEGYTGYTAAEEKLQAGEITESEATIEKSEAVGSGVGVAAGGYGGALAGAAMGAAVGSVVPIIGTAIGGVLGAAIGGLAGSYAGEKIGGAAGEYVGEKIVEPNETGKEENNAEESSTNAAPVQAKSLDEEKKETDQTSLKEAPPVQAVTPDESRTEMIEDLEEKAAAEKALAEDREELQKTQDERIAAFVSKLDAANKNLTNLTISFAKFDKQLRELLGETEDTGPSVTEEVVGTASSLMARLKSMIGFGPSEKKPAGPPIDVSGELGGLSARYESGSRGSEAVGFDTTGGTSYGKYQIATRTGTMDKFLEYLKDTNPEAYDRLSKAGPADAGKSGKFAEEWKALAAEGTLGTSEHDFIKKTHFDEATSRLESEPLRKMIEESKALQEVMWSTSVQHGAGVASSIFEKSFQDGMSEEDLIKQIYANRRTKFGSSTPGVRASVMNRFDEEEMNALSLIGMPVEPETQVASTTPEPPVTETAKTETETQVAVSATTTSPIKTEQPKLEVAEVAPIVEPKIISTAQATPQIDLAGLMTDMSSPVTSLMKGYGDIMSEIVMPPTVDLTTIKPTIPETPVATSPTIMSNMEPIESSSREIIAMNSQLVETLTSKLDIMIEKLDTSNGIQDRLLRQAAV